MQLTMLENGELIPGVQLVPSQMFIVCLYDLTESTHGSNCHSEELLPKKIFHQKFALLCGSI